MVRESPSEPFLQITFGRMESRKIFSSTRRTDTGNKEKWTELWDYKQRDKSIHRRQHTEQAGSESTEKRNQLRALRGGMGF